jgi:hypothetical protein
LGWSGSQTPAKAGTPTRAGLWIGTTPGDPAICRPVPALDRGTGGAVRTHRFTLILAGVPELTPELADALYEATKGDIECNMQDGIAYLEFERMAATLREAITSAIEDVENADVGVRVVRVESDVANTIAQINASLLGAAPEQ